MMKVSRVCREAFGFVGLGQMGARMAPNIFKDANVTRLVLFDVSSEAVEGVRKAVAALGTNKTVEVAANPAEVARRCKKLITMLPNGKVVSQVYNDPVTGIFAALQPGSIVIDSSTIDAQTPKTLADTARSAKQSLFFDAPVSGGVNAAAAGTLTFMVGSPAMADFAAARQILQHFAKSVVDCGATGSGQVCKLCNNLILGQHMVAVSEAMLMGTRLGVDPKILAGVFNTSTGRCWSSDTYNPYPGIFPNIPSANEYKGGFGSSLMLKDLGLALEAAKSVDLTVAGAANAHGVYTQMVDAKMGGMDFSGVIKHIDGQGGKKQL